MVEIFLLLENYKIINYNYFKHQNLIVIQFLVLLHQIQNIYQYGQIKLKKFKFGKMNEYINIFIYLYIFI